MSSQNYGFCEDSTQRTGLSQMGAATQMHDGEFEGFDYGDDGGQLPKNDFSQLERQSQSSKSGGSSVSL